MSTELPFDPVTGEIREAASTNATEYSVSEIAQALKRTIEQRFGYVRVRGEITGYRGPHSSGHCYFGLKDEGAKLDAVIWRGNFAKLRPKLQEGLEVIATGKITSYPGKSSYQIIVDNLEPAGVGALMALLEERKKKLAAEGLFDATRKKPLPYLPRVIGVVTSPTGAVIRDILHRLGDRFPRHVMVWPVRVQGDTSAAEVAAAIRGFNAMAVKPDLIIVARGGGSLEDLWGFNEEVVVRAVAASVIPLISAVGHETDTTLIDLAADWRAPTPTAAAERAVPVRADLVAQVASLAARHRRGISRALDERRTRVRAAERALPRPDDILALARQRLDAATQGLKGGLMRNVQEHRRRLAGASARLTPLPLKRFIATEQRRLNDLTNRARLAAANTVKRRRDSLSSVTKLLDALSYASVLQRGFALVKTPSGKLVRAASATSPGEALKVEFADGAIDVTRDPASKQGKLF